MILTNFFPGLIKLREKAIVLCNHAIAASACVPSRAVVKLPGSTTYKSIDKLTGHIDILPTLLGLAGINLNELAVTQVGVDYFGKQLIGADLSNLIRGIDADIYKDGKIRNEILLVTDDMITQPLDTPNNEEDQKYGVFTKAIYYYKSPDSGRGTYKKKENALWEQWTQYLKDGAVCSPCRVQCVHQGNWKLVRYFEDSNSETGNP